MASNNKISKTYRLDPQIVKALEKRAAENEEYQTRIIERALQQELLKSGHLKEKIYP